MDSLEHQGSLPSGQSRPPSLGLSERPDLPWSSSQQAAAPSSQCGGWPNPHAGSSFHFGGFGPSQRQQNIPHHQTQSNGMILKLNTLQSQAQDVCTDRLLGC